MTGILSETNNGMNSVKAQTVIRFDPKCRLVPQMSAAAILNIQGIHEVRVDEPSKKIHVIFDGMSETKRRLSAYLCACERKPLCGATQSCGGKRKPEEIVDPNSNYLGQEGVAE